MIKLLIEEEYGYRWWLAELTQDEYAQLLRRWETMRGLCCKVPVPLIVPQAVRISDDEMITMWNRESVESFYRCHVDDYDSSYIEGSCYEIPLDEYFWMDGQKYSQYRSYHVEQTTTTNQAN
jgi:hypothetical protein